MAGTTGPRGTELTAGRVARARCRHSVPFLATATISKPSSAIERSSPAPSVLWPTSRPPAHSTVLTAPMSSAAGDRASRWSTTAALHGMVTFSPAYPSARAPATASPMPSASTSWHR